MESSCESDVSLIIDGEPDRKVAPSIGEEIQEFDYLSVPQNSHVGNRGHEIQDLLDEAEGLRQTVATVEADWEAFKQESLELRRQLERSRNQLQVLSQEVAARGKKLKEVNQAHQPLVRELKREIEQKSLRNMELEKEIENMRSEYQQRVQGLEEQLGEREREVQDLLDEAGEVSSSTQEEIEKLWATYEPNLKRFEPTITKNLTAIQN